MESSGIVNHGAIKGKNARSEDVRDDAEHIQARSNLEALPKRRDRHEMTINKIEE